MLPLRIRQQQLSLTYILHPLQPQQKIKRTKEQAIDPKNHLRCIMIICNYPYVVYDSTLTPYNILFVSICISEYSILYIK